MEQGHEGRGTSQSPPSRRKRASSDVTLLVNFFISFFLSLSLSLSLTAVKMVKLASVRECRTYGPPWVRNRWEYINAGLHVFSALLLVAGFGTLLAGGGVAGLYMMLVALIIVAVVNAHDLIAHLINLDFRLPLMGLDAQFLIVELASPLVQFLGSVFTFLAILFLLIEKKRKLEKYALNLLIAGPALWLAGSIQNACQVYERADGLLQVLQKGVYLPFLMGSQLLLVAGILNRQTSSHSAHGPSLLGRTWVWLGLSGSLLYFIGGLANVLKVFKMQRLDWTRLEQLRGVRREGWWRESETRTPLVSAEQRKASVIQEGGAPLPPPPSPPYTSASAVAQP